MSKRLVVIDGKSVFYRGYYAMPNLSTKDGRPTGGVYGFAVMALEVMKKLTPDYVAVAWDKPKTNIRSRLALYPQYKANRKPAPPDFYEQVPILHQLLESMGWPIYEADDQEADDIMGAFAKQAQQKGIETYLVSSDLDILQLINKHTHIYTLKKGVSNIELFDTKAFEDKYKIGPEQFIDLKALKGDSSDNVPGVAGVGEKTAIELLSKYKTLDGVYEHLDEIKPTLRAKLESGKDMAYLSKKLVTLDVDAPVQLDFDHAKVKDGFTPEFVAMLRDLEFKALLKRVGMEMSEDDVRQAEFALGGEKPKTANEVTNLDLKSGQSRLVTMDQAIDKILLSVDGSSYQSVDVSQLNKQKIDEIVNGPLIGHDLKSVIKQLISIAGEDLNVQIEHDTSLAAFLINSLERSLNISDLVGHTIDMTHAGEICAAIWQLYKEQEKVFAKNKKLAKLAREIDFPTAFLLAKIEHRGVKLDTKHLREMSIRLAKSIEEREKEIYAQAGQEFNISSPRQLSVVLFEKLGLPTLGVKSGKTGLSTGAKELAKLRNLHPIIDMITDYRELTKLKSTYVDALPDLVATDGRLHTTFTQEVAATGRLSSSNPNLQNIPTRTELGQEIRTAFIAEKGNVLVSADYNQFELRLSAVLSGDDNLIKDFSTDVDIHAKTAADIYGIDIKDVTKNQRRQAKVINFGILYGMSPHGLSVATGMNMNDAKQFIEKYFEIRKPLRRYAAQIIEEGLSKGYVETLFGRRRPTPDLKSSNFVVREAAKRAAINMPIQGTEADLMKMAMLKIEDELGDLGKQILQIHDSILVECPEKNAKRVGEILKEQMESIYKLPVKLSADVKSGKHWGEI